MSDGTLIALGAALIGIAVGIAESLKSAKRARAFEKRAETLWMLLSQPIVFRKPDSSDGVVLQLLESAPRAELERSLISLGDLIMEIVGTPHKSSLRVFVDSSHTVVAYWGGHTNHLSLESYCDAGEFVTHRGGSGSVVTPAPFSHVQRVPATEPIDDTLKKHHEFIDKDVRLIPVASLDEAQAQFDRIHQMTRTWRSTHDPDQLLASDLRIMLGDKGFAMWGEGWIKRFKKLRSPPKAVARERPRQN